MNNNLEHIIASINFAKEQKGDYDITCQYFNVKDIENLILTINDLEQKLIDQRHFYLEKLKENNNKIENAIVTLISWGEILDPLFQSTMLNILEENENSRIIEKIHNE